MGSKKSLLFKKILISPLFFRASTKLIIRILHGILDTQKFYHTVATSSSSGGNFDLENVQNNLKNRCLKICYFLKKILGAFILQYVFVNKMFIWKIFRSFGKYLWKLGSKTPWKGPKCSNNKPTCMNIPLKSV